MNGTTASRPAGPPGLSDKILFWASFLTLIAAGIGFSVRGAILGDWGKQFGFTQFELGTITGGGLAGFGVAIIFFSFCADRFGYGKLMLIAFLLHASSAVVTFAATPVYNAGGIPALGLGAKDSAYWCLFVGMLMFALGNGTCEAVINPLTATLFPTNKTHWLNILHAGWPAGLILGALIVLGFENLGQDITWEMKLGVFLVPVLLYGVLMFNRTFPRSEAAVAGISMNSMMREVGVMGIGIALFLFGLWLSQDIIPNLEFVKLPGWVGWAIAGAIWLGYGFLTGFSPGHVILTVLYLLHALVGYVELGTDSWITNITETVLADKNKALLAFIWTNLLMTVLRFFAGPIVEKINPIGLLFCSAVLGTAGLVLLGLPQTDSLWLWMGAVTVYGIGKTFYWPTMLGVISERFPKGGALALGISGGIGMLSAGLLGGPGIGYKQDYFAVQYLTKDSDAAREAAYGRYKAMKEVEVGGVKKEVEDKRAFLAFTGAFPPVTGLDGAKVGTLLGDPGKDNGDGKKLAADIANVEGRGRTLADFPALKRLNEWWQSIGKPHAPEDTGPIAGARLFGSKNALLYTALVPAALAVGYLLLLLFFAVTGGYKQVHIHQEPPMGEY